MRPIELSRALAAVLPTGRPVYVWGPPGGGKSSVVRQAAAAVPFRSTPRPGVARTPR